MVKEIEMKQDNVRVFILSHKPVSNQFPNDLSYRYVQCGAVGNHIQGFDLYDDTGNTTSDLNWCLSEATAISMITRNRSLTEGFDFIGFGQYRRYLDCTNQTFAGNSIYCSKMDLGMPVIIQYGRCHPLNAYTAFMNIIFHEDRVLFTKIVEYFNTANYLYRANCFITDNELFLKYSQFVNRLTPVFEQIIRSNCIDITGYSPYQKRYMSFLFERLTSYWIDSLRSGGIDVIDVKLIDIDIPNTENGTR